MESYIRKAKAEFGEKNIPLEIIERKRLKAKRAIGKRDIGLVYTDPARN